jgi:hypothetical protein
MSRNTVEMLAAKGLKVIMKALEGEDVVEESRSRA